MKKSCILAFLFLFSVLTYSQTTESKADTTQTPKIGHSPKKAALMSAILPGSGQIYNRKYWKAPVLYAGLGMLGYVFVDNRHNYLEYRDAFRAKTDTTLVDLFPERSIDQLKLQKDAYRSNMELSVLLTVGVYLINIIDATVDAHLFRFDVSEDLSLSVHPSCYYASNRVNSGVSLTLNFR